MKELAKHIEHTILKPDCTAQEVRQICEEALQHQFAGVCIPPLFVRDARRILGEESPVKIVTVVGFPMGYSAMAAKSEEIKRAAEDGADDVDAVANIAAIKSGNWTYVRRDLDSLARAAQIRGCALKVILECGLLTEEEMRQVCAMVEEIKIPFVKTGTGFHGHPATPDMVRMLRQFAPNAKVKAAGGIKTAKAARQLLEAGAERIGCSASLAIIGAAQ
jgi:deoxyribose-phosphate aldolase